jgi:hypothetical protein
MNASPDRKENVMDTFIYADLDGREWVIRSHSLSAAQAGAHAAELRRTQSLAAAILAARSVRREFA